MIHPPDYKKKKKKNKNKNRIREIKLVHRIPVRSHIVNQGQKLDGDRVMYMIRSHYL